jgi:hypothetical protein
MDTERLNYLQDNHMALWLKTRQGMEEDLSDQQGMFCVCGRLATGFHESSCRKFQDKVTNETIKSLQYVGK